MNKKSNYEKLKEKIKEVRSDVVYYRKELKDKVNLLDKFEEKLVILLDEVQEVSAEVYDIYEDLSMVIDECDEALEIIEDINLNKKDDE